MACLELLISASLLGQTGDAAPSSVAVQSIWDFVVKGGPMMAPIILCSLVAMAVTVERAVSLRRKRVIPSELRSQLGALLSDEAEPNAKAVAQCSKDGSPLARVLAAGIKRFGEPIDRLERHVEEEGQRVIADMRKYLRTLSVIAAITPLMGLLGTIFGMIKAFQTVAVSGEALGKTELLAKGIYEAMITTAAGLLVAIPALITFHWISARIDTLVRDIDSMTVDFIEEHAAGHRQAALPDNGEAAAEVSAGLRQAEAVST